MADIELVIKIPEEMYDWFDHGFLDEKDAENLWQIVKRGTPLPKGHGRLIDADAVSLDDIGFFSIGDYQKMVHKLTTSERTIIEADKESEGEE